MMEKMITMQDVIAEMKQKIESEIDKLQKEANEIEHEILYDEEVSNLQRVFKRNQDDKSVKLVTKVFNWTKEKHTTVSNEYDDKTNKKNLLLNQINSLKKISQELIANAPCEK